MTIGLEKWPGKKIKLEEGAISEIQVADTDSESDAKASDVEGYFKEGGGRGGVGGGGGEEQQQQQQQQLQASAEVEPQAAKSG